MGVLGWDIGEVLTFRQGLPIKSRHVWKLGKTWRTVAWRWGPQILRQVESVERFQSGESIESSGGGASLRSVYVNRPPDGG